LDLGFRVTLTASDNTFAPLSEILFRVLDLGFRVTLTASDNTFAPLSEILLSVGVEIRA